MSDQKKLYVVTYTDYEEHEIRGIFSNRELAEAWVVDDNEIIEEYALNPEGPRIAPQFHVTRHNDGTITEFEEVRDRCKFCEKERIYSYPTTSLQQKGTPTHEAFSWISYARAHQYIKERMEQERRDAENIDTSYVIRKAEAPSDE